MSYLAIARKWRPKTFDAIVGQGHVTRTLKNAIQRGRIHHAFLFTGSRGVGKTTAARALARALNCAEGPTPDPCGECPLCVSILAGAAPDVVEIDGASNNSVDDIRELRDGVRFPPSHGRYRVYIIDEVHMLTRAAFNALLKTLEEPPPHVVFIFATTEVQKIPETILSRVQRFDFKRIPGSQVAERLRMIVDAEECRISDNALRMIARAGEGSMRDSQSLLDQVISFGGHEVSDSQVAELLGLVDRSLLFRMLEGLVTSNPSICMEAIAAVHDYGFEMSEFTEELLEIIRNAALLALAPDMKRYIDISGDEVQRLADLVGDLDAEVFTRWFDSLMEVHDRVARAARPRLVLEMAVARLATIKPAQHMDQIVSRLEDLHRKLRGFGPAGSPGPGTGPGGGGGRAASPAVSTSGGQPPPHSRSRETEDAAHTHTREHTPAPQREEPAPAAPQVATPAPQREEPAPAAPQVAHPPGGSLKGAELAARYADALDSFSQLDVTWLSLVEHSVPLSFEGGVLEIGFKSAFHKNQSTRRLSDEAAHEVLGACFPGFRQAISRLLNGEGESRLTRQEERQLARKERLECFRDTMEEHPMVSSLRQHLGMELVDVKLEEEEHLS